MTRRFTPPGLAIVIAMLSILTVTSAVAAAHITVTVSLSGSEEVPQPGDPNGRGSGTVSLYPSTDNPTGGNVCYELKLQGIETPTAGHIHAGADAVAGPPVVFFDFDTATRRGNRYTQCLTADQDVVDAIRANPSAYYVNIHTATYAGGAIRGQLGS